MSHLKKQLSRPDSITQTVRKRMVGSDDRVWRLDDFPGVPPSAVAQALSRLARQGAIQRFAKGLYFWPRPTPFGPSKPNPTSLLQHWGKQKGVFPAGIAAANLLGFTTQQSARVEVATTGSSLPRAIFGDTTVIHSRRPKEWKSLDETDAALLDFLRNRGKWSEMSPKETVLKLLKYFRQGDRFSRILKVASTEPPRVRAMLGAIGDQIGIPERSLKPLRSGLNPFSRFDFGLLASLKHARTWQGKESPGGAAL